MSEEVRITLPPGITAKDIQNMIAKAKPSSVRIPDEKVFAEIEVGPTQKIKVYKDTYKGRVLLAIRKFWVDDGGVWQPGKGVTFPAEAIAEIIGGLKLMDEWCSEEGVEGNESIDY